VIYESPTPIHVSGHGYQEELKMMINLTRPYYLAPVHGEPRHQHMYLEMAREMGYPEHRIFMLEDGVPLVLDETNAYFGEPVPVGRVLVDYSGTPGISTEVLRDRYNIAKDGLIVITIAVDLERGEFIGDPMVPRHERRGSEVRAKAHQSETAGAPHDRAALGRRKTGMAPVSITGFG
jgi:ribonuclease J